MKVFGRAWIGALLFLPFFLSSGWALEPLEKKSQEIEKLLMAPCCWNATVADHDSGATADVKREIRQFLEAGQSQGEILSYFEKKYGERILAKPKPDGFNHAIWWVPTAAFLFALGFIVLLLRFWRRHRSEEVERADMESQKDSPHADQKYREQIERELYGDSASRGS